MISLLILQAAYKIHVKEATNLALHLGAYHRAIKIFEELGKAYVQEENLK
jgi:hypothetical protein